MLNAPLPPEVQSKDFILSPVQGLLDQHIPRLMEFGPRSALPMGLNDAPVERLDRAVAATKDHAVEPEETTILDMFAMAIFSKLIGAAFHSPGLETAAELGLEARHAGLGIEHAAQRSAGLAEVMAIDPAAQLDPNLVFMPNGRISILPSLKDIGNKIPVQNDPKKPVASGTRNTVRFGKRGSSWA